ncbi:MAG: epoxyqueuosine reductase [Spirochaetales bacterium]|nr:epoxyqueuosine reductase [Spirochaetales bacterium]
MLVTKEYGSALRLNSVFTDMPLDTDEPVTASRCGTCMNCVTACPAHAPKGNAWAPDVHRDSFFDASACADKARHLCIKNTGINETICGMCIVACPFTQTYLNKHKSP